MFWLSRSPLVLRADTYAVWALLAGAIIGLKWIQLSRDWNIYAHIKLTSIEVSLMWAVPEEFAVKGGDSCRDGS